MLRLAALAALLAAQACFGQASPPPATPGDCRQALAALKAEEDRAAAANADRPAGQIPKALQAVRRAAARACLGGPDEPPPPTQSFTPPVSALPPPAPRAPAAPPVGAALPLPATPAPVRPPVVTTCDATGCWTSDGARLQRLGPNLVGPRGVCTVQGKIVTCR